MPKRHRSDDRYIEPRTLKSGAVKYRIDVPHPVTKERYRDTFHTVEAARHARDSFLRDAELHHAQIAPANVTVAQAVDRLLDELKDGRYLARGGVGYKPSTLRLYEDTLTRLLVPALGRMQLRDVRDDHLQELVDGWVANGVAPGTIQNRWVSVRVLFRFAFKRKLLVGSANPCDLVDRPSNADGRRDRVVSVRGAQALLDCLEAEPRLQLIYAMAFFCGLRRGEIQALRWEDVDLAAGKLRVTRSFDASVSADSVPRGAQVLGWPDEHRGAFITPKSRAAMRPVPIPQAALRYLAKFSLDSGRSTGLVCGRAANVPFTDYELRQVQALWARFDLEGVVLHEARHTYASCMIAAGANAKSLQVYMGHSSITVTYDLYGHLMPGNEAESAALLDSYLERELGATA